MKKTYTVENTYGIAGQSNHRTPEAAIKAAGKREGIGWIVTDSGGHRWDHNGSAAVIVD